MKKILSSLILTLVMSLVLLSPALADQSLTLKNGFNFISFNQSLSLTAAQFKQLNASIEDVYLYSPASGSFLSAGEGTLSNLSAGKGYIVKSSSASNITVTVPGSALGQIGNITLKAGFNLAGFSKMPETVKFSELMARYSKISGMYKWSPAAGTFLQVVRNPSTGVIEQLEGYDPVMAAAESYFINMSEEQPLNYDGSSIIVGTAPQAQKIIFTSNRSSSGYPEIYSMNLDGSAQTKISNHDFKLYSPAVSPDGSKIAYVGEIGSGYDIYVMNIDGSNYKKLTGDNQSSWPSWSPDGSKIAYVRSQEIWTMNADGSNQAKLNVITSSGIYGLGSPCWSPDGSKISVTGFFSSSSNIYSINLTSLTMTQITVNTGMNIGAAWSPDGSNLVFCSDMSSNPLETGFKVYSITASGQNQIPLTTAFTSRHTAKYSWSADGKKILFSEARPGDSNYIQIYIMNSDGSNAVRLTDPSAKDNDSPCFVPLAK